jgi:hypothetical protein
MPSGDATGHSYALRRVRCRDLRKWRTRRREFLRVSPVFDDFLIVPIWRDLTVRGVARYGTIFPLSRSI